MKKQTGQFIYWTPRVLSIAFIVFLALFSLDVFSPELNFWQMAAGFFIHNIPSITLLIVLLISWKREIVGGIVFIIVGILFTARMLVVMATDGYEPGALFQLIIAAPALLIGVLFVVNWLKKRNNR